MRQEKAKPSSPQDRKHFIFRSSDRRGNILILSIFFLIILFFLATAFFSLLPERLNVALREETNMELHYAADAGIQDAIERISSQTWAGTVVDTSTIASNMSGSSFLSYSVVITPLASTGNLAVYQLQSTGSNGLSTRTITADIEQQSYGNYAFSVGSNTYGGSQVWWVPGMFVDGPVYNDDQMNVYVPSGYYSSPESPIFLSKVYTANSYSSGDSVNYCVTGSLCNPPYGGEDDEEGDDSNYSDIYEGGRSDLITNSAPLKLPTGDTMIQNAAWGSSSGFPTTSGVHVNSQSGSGSYPLAPDGIYVVGDVTPLTYSVDVSGNQLVDFWTPPGGSEYHLTYVTTSAVTLPSGSVINGTASTSATTIPTGSTISNQVGTNNYSVYQGLTNGTFYVNGSIDQFSGTIEGKRTLSCSGNLKITNNILLNGVTTGNPPPGDSQNEIGLVAPNVEVGAAAPNDVYVYADIYSVVNSSGNLSGEFYAENYDSRPTGTVYVFGSEAEGEYGPTGTFSPSGSQTISYNWYQWGYSNGWNLTGTTTETQDMPFSIATGDLQVIHYDPRLMSSPPPYFPSTGNFRLVYWSEK